MSAADPTKGHLPRLHKMYHLLQLHQNTTGRSIYKSASTMTSTENAVDGGSYKIRPGLHLQIINNSGAFAIMTLATAAMKHHRPRLQKKSSGYGSNTTMSAAAPTKIHYQLNQMCYLTQLQQNAARHVAYALMGSNVSGSIKCATFCSSTKMLPVMKPTH